jgi:hypothetical protein
MAQGLLKGLPVGFARLASLVITLASTACVIPIPAEIEEGDAGGGSAPVIIASNPDMSSGTITLSDSAPITASLTIRDNDLDDTLYVKVFRDYVTNQPPVHTTSIPADAENRTRDRIKELDTDNWCNGGAVGSGNLNFEVMVADRPFLEDSEEPAYRALPPEANFSIRSWTAQCVE